MHVILLTIALNVLFAAETTHCKLGETNSVILSVGDLGLIRGKILRTRNTGSKFYQFYSIPYGNTPTRFKPSEMKKGPLSGAGEQPYDATKFLKQCPQASGGDEDCLTVNVATKFSKPRTLAPVILFIHGGIFIRGNSSKFDGQYLLKNNLVVVSFNYRLGVFGYYGFANDAAPGNAALYDALLLLRWVQKYIAYFGGDPKRVTISGQSAGSATVTHLILSPLSKGLFHSAIAMSGTALNDWAVTADPTNPSLRISELAGCYNPNKGSSNCQECNKYEKIVRCMETLPVAKLLQAQHRYQKEERLQARHGLKGLNPSITFNNLRKYPTVIPDYPVNILKSGLQMNVPLMIGSTKQDGEYSLGNIFFGYILPKQLYKNPNYLRNRLIPEILKSVGITFRDEAAQKSYGRKYLGDCLESGNFTAMIGGLTDLNTALYFKDAQVQYSKLHSKKNRVYLYSFDFKGTKTLHAPIIPFPGGVAHSDDLLYLFPMIDYKLNKDESIVSNSMIDSWTDFAKFGFPTHQIFGIIRKSWPKFNAKSQKHLIINLESKPGENFQANIVNASRIDLARYWC